MALKNWDIAMKICKLPQQMIKIFTLFDHLPTADFTIIEVNNSLKGSLGYEVTDETMDLFAQEGLLLSKGKEGQKYYSLPQKVRRYVKTFREVFYSKPDIIINFSKLPTNEHEYYAIISRFAHEPATISLEMVSYVWRIDNEKAEKVLNDLVALKLLKKVANGRYSISVESAAFATSLFD